MKILMSRCAICVGVWLAFDQAGMGADTGAGVATSRFAPEAGTNGLLSLKDLEMVVLRENPSLKAARANWEAMKQRVPQARAWEDARAGFDTVAGRFVSIPPNSFTDQKLMAEQAVPLSGRNLLRGKAAEAEALAAYGELRRR